MSDYSAIQSVTRSLQSLLRRYITDDSDPQLRNVIVDLRSPKQMREDNDAAGISLWLYQVTRDSDMLNEPQLRVSRDRVRRKPLPVHLHYLVTPIRPSQEDEHVLLGRVLQVLQDHSELGPADLAEPLRSESTDYRIVLEALSLEEVSRIWNALQEPYRLSVSYLAQMVRIDSLREPIRSAPVETRETVYSQILDAGD